MQPVISHGDFRLGNMIAQGPTIKAVIDWEIWALGDPRLDLAWLRLNADPDAYRFKTPFLDVMPSGEDLLESYTGASELPVASLHWFDALVRFKATAVWSLILKRGHRSGDGRFDDVTPALPRLVDSARSLLR
jgi:aminoglycoside phosphotransferase (APT) family kinase protein